MMDSRDRILDLMRAADIPITRQNFIDVNWGDRHPEWNAELEAELPEELQDWSLYEVRGDELVPKSAGALVEKADKPKPKSEFQSDKFKNGVFVAAHVNHDSATKIYEYARKLKLPKEAKLIEPVDYHATLIYSEQPFEYQHDIQSSVYPVKVKSHKTLKVLGTALVLAFVSALLQRRHDELKDQGGKHSFSEYKPHVTIAEVPTDTSLKQLGGYKGPIEFTSESARPIEAPKKKKEETTVSLWPLKEEDYETFMDRCVAAFLPCIGEEAGTEVCDGKWDASEKLGKKGFVTKAEVGEQNARSPCGESCLACNEAPLDMRRDWDESKHPREPAGSPGGGQFAGGGDGGGDAGESHAAKLDRVIASVPGAKEKVAEARAKLAQGVRTDAPVEQGGFKRADGSWTPGRQAVHEGILKDMFSADKVRAAMPKPGEQPMVHLLGGSGGSGKGWFVGPKGTVKTDNAIYVNSDDVKERLPGYEGWNAAHYHEESSDVSKTAEQLARDHRLNVILDGTMSKRDSLHTRIEQYKAAGYRIEGHFMRVKPETSAKRALERFVRAKTGTGRFVPPEHVLSLGANLGNFESERASMAAWEIYDNEGKAPELVARARHH
jgi:predicted ABC-type ATPase/2'-5' RNA ligase